jgi:hemoglobin
MNFIAARLLLACLLLSPFGTHAAEPSLYERIGGEAVMLRVTEQMLTRVAADPAVNQSFAGINIHKLSIKLASHLCAMTGGGCAPASDSIKVIHAGLGIDERQFFTVVESLRIALDANGVGEREKNELLRMLAPLKRDVVTR